MAESGLKLLLLLPEDSEALVTSISPKRVRGLVEVVGGMPPEEVMARAWWGVTVDFSIAVEGALKKIRFFLCGWLDFVGMGYIQQFARFGAGRILKTPDELEHITGMVADYRTDPVALERLWHEADPARLDAILFGSRQVRLDPCA